MKPPSFLLVSSIFMVWFTLDVPAHAQSLVNPDFSDGLNGWNVSESGGDGAPGTVSVVGGQAEILEGDSFLVTLQQTFTVSSIASTLSFDIIQNPGFDQTDAFIPDAFEVSLLDANSNSVVPTWKLGATSFFNMQENGTVHLGSTTTFDGTTVTVNMQGIAPGAEVTLFFDFIGGETDVNGGVRVDSVVTRDLEPLLVPVDIKPPSCPNPLSLKKKGRLSVAILGTADFDVSQVNVATVRLEGVAPISSAFEDLATPFVPFTGKTDALDCTEQGPDGFLDLRFAFDEQ
ncbi:MAG: hypothetical protein O6942_01015, partial [Bacteroidetes bacterium]|nr:hypothetical protein [Bacteroidota bacterium]